MRPMLRLLAIASVAAAFGCAGHDAAALDADNPIRPNAAPPYGMEEFFKDGVAPDPARARLGRWLFYDVRLSADDSLSCASCHRPSHAFSEPSAVATGINAGKGTRKTPGIVNLAARTVLPDQPDDREQFFFWDGRATGLENQVLGPIANGQEMGLDHDAMVQRFSGIAGYAPYFKEAFGSTAIARERVAAALADYVRTRMSGNSAYDKWAYGRDGTALSEKAQRGSEIFFFSGRCAVCHAGFNFSDGRFHAIGSARWWSSTTVAAGGRMQAADAWRRCALPNSRSTSSSRSCIRWMAKGTLTRLQSTSRGNTKDTKNTKEFSLNANASKRHWPFD